MRIGRILFFATVGILLPLVLSACCVPASAAAEWRLSFDGGTVTVSVEDNPTVREIAALLPLTLTFEDYARTEKIAYLPQKPAAEDAPDGYRAAAGDLTLYTPWGNLAFFYEDGAYARGLVYLGHVSSGVEHLKTLDGAAVKIELADRKN